MTVGDFRQSAMLTAIADSTFASDDSFVTLDLSFDAHVFPGRGSDTGNNMRRYLS